MAGFDYGRMAGVATRLLGRFAQGAVVLVRPGVGTPGENEYDPPIPGVPTSYPLRAAVAVVTVDQANAKYIDGTVITSADLVVTCAVPPVTPEMTDTVTLDGVARTIKKIVQVPAVGVPIVFKLFVQG
jgi:hypothetical protein